MKKKKAVINWSSGKDSALTLFKLRNDSSIEIKYLLTTINKDLDRVSMHGVRTSLLKKQSESIGIPLRIIELPPEPSLDEYNSIMKNELTKLNDEGIEYSAFGDIFLEDLRKYREEKLNEAGMKALFPLWKTDTKKLFSEFIQSGFRAKIVCVNDEFFDASFCGMDLNENFLNNIPNEVDICGENGEYHTFVYDGPIFSKPIKFAPGEVVHKQYQPCNKNKNRCEKNCEKGKKEFGFWYLDLMMP